MEWLPARLRDVRAFIQRGRRGWADRDTWNLDEYLARVTGQALAHLADTGHGYPDDGTAEGSSPGAWQTYQRELALAFLDYALARQKMTLGWDDYEKLLNRMRPLFDHFGALWD